MGRQSHHKTSTILVFGVQMKRPTVSIHDPLTDRQAKPCALNLILGMQPLQWLENPFGIFGRGDGNLRTAQS